MSLRKTILGSIALLCLTAYIIACRASFSPDGSRILVPYIASAPHGTAVALVDRATAKARCVFVNAEVGVKDRKRDLAPLVVQWTPDGTRAAVFYFMTEGDDRACAAVLSVDGPGETRLFRFGHDESDNDLFGALAVPPAIVGEQAFLGGGCVLRLDLRTGELRAGGREDIEDVFCAAAGGGVFYWCKTRDGAYEWGRLDPASLGFTAVVKIPKDAAGGGLGVFAAPNADGSRLAVVSENAEAVHIFKGATLERIIEKPAGAEKWRFGNAVWSRDSQALFAAVARSGAPGKDAYAVIETPAAGGAARDLLVIPGNVSTSEDTVKLFLQVALSPDGTTLAVPMTYLDVGDADRALYLIDVASAGRDVKKIPIPGSASPEGN